MTTNEFVVVDLCGPLLRQGFGGRGNRRLSRGGGWVDHGGMSPQSPTDAASEIHIRGAREHNLRDIEVRIDRRHLTVVTGVSGSGKSSLAFDTLYAEGYRKYIDSLSTRARQYLEQLPRPNVDFIHGLSPVIAIEQRTGAGANPRSTVATITELADYARLLWAVAAEPRCPLDGGRIRRRTLDDCVDEIMALPDGTRLLLGAPVMKARPAVLREELPRLRQRGFQRIRIDGVLQLLDAPGILESGRQEVQVDVIVDRLVAGPEQRSRLADSLELAFREGRDRAFALVEESSAKSVKALPEAAGELPATAGWRMLLLSQHLACEHCGRTYEALTPRHFSPNHPSGACPTCAGLGQVLSFAPELIVPAPEKSIKQGAIKPWRLGSKRMIIARNAILKQLAAQVPFDPLVAWQDQPEAVRHLLLHGSGERSFEFRLRARQKVADVHPFAGVLADLDQTRRETSSDGLRARLHAYQVSAPCPVCEGMRLAPYPQAAKVGGKGFAELMAASILEAGAFVRGLPDDLGETATAGGGSPLGEVLQGLRDRLGFLDEVGLGYLTLNREYATLSGGEAQRVRLATQLGMGLVGVTYVLDEPSVGLHAQDEDRLIALLRDLRDRGNAVVVVEHDDAMMRAADRLIELGPGAGPAGGRVVFTGTPEAAMASPTSLTGAYLAGRRKLVRECAELAVPAALPQPVPARLDGRWLVVRGACEHNLRGFDAALPVGLFTCVTGVSGSGKSTLVHDLLGPAAAFKLHRAKAIPGRHTRIDGLGHFESVVRVDQDGIGRSPRSNPVTYTKLFDTLRDLFAAAPLAKVRGYGRGRFSFNLSGGRCEACRGDGSIALDMQFLSDVYTVCPSCEGRRYNRETLEVRFKGLNMAEVLALTVDEARVFFRAVPKLKEKLDTLAQVGLGYLALGQPANTLSGGEAQRLRLSLELSRRQQGSTLYLLDEPTTGLHWADIQHLLDVLFRLRDAGNTIVLVEHHLDVIDLADWIVDLGPGGGDAGGHLLYAGPRAGFEEAAPATSATAACLRQRRAQSRACQTGKIPHHR